MKVYVYYHPEGPKNSELLGSADLDILPQVGHAIRYNNLADHFEDGIVKEIRWDLTDENDPHVVVLVAPAK